ncbi:MAG: formyltransferase family protein, partial [Puniceicoccales bacterium]
MDLIFLSSDAISLPTLEALARGEVNDLRIVAVITNPDRRSGRGKKLQRNVVAAKAEELGIPVHQTPKLTRADFDSLPSFDAALVFAFGQILPKAVLALRPGLFLNVHASPLP